MGKIDRMETNGIIEERIKRSITQLKNKNE